ncbi:alcohol dehydrogenase, putative [Phytophthora infestans T30-4]|uniref:Alcohol dehydrogenase, putative n=1 Tax=Phytophthora infestans (strain T30-4) TaxID=403677 RepID=D0NHP7_PHYIT|nr:alcohol dehydrogenase, putative [Phytophthora infestans T30-4]EEY58972.1 alcohol dehydrogenase, putative [Phytophthora infestans T30-4]|eukprot:XP_002901445.1 alcohol dehydrogenase, putative [Phytophthora infestans T30-4]
MTFPSTYRAYQYEKYGPIETELKLKAGLPQRTLSAQQVRIKVRSAAVNPIDYKLAEFMGQMFFGKAPSVDEPFNVGFDVSGEVVEVGSDVKRVKIGAAVYASTPLNDMGTLAEYLVVDEGFAALKPSNLNFNQAAALPTAALTAYAGMTTHAELKKDDAVLILGGSTAVGMFAIQFAHNIGARVITTTSTRNVELVKSMGADQVIDYTKDKWTDVLARHLVDVLYDCGVEPSSWNDGAQLVLKKKVHYLAANAGAREGIRIRRAAHRISQRCRQFGESAGGDYETALDAYKKLKTNHAQGELVVQVHV